MSVEDFQPWVDRPASSESKQRAQTRRLVGRAAVEQ